MGKIFRPKTYSYYLGEQRPLNGIVVGFTPEPQYFLVNQYDCDCNGLLNDQIYYDPYGLITPTPNLFFSDDSNPAMKFFIVSIVDPQTPDFTLGLGATIDENLDCDLLTCF